ncbi:MAG: alpha/beta hydrolase [Hyphomicrobiales bacterium]|nr:alpha/beta hydrolase [Hyphomicrobiales bacterium]
MTDAATTSNGPEGIAFGALAPDALGTPHRPFRYFSADGLALAGRDYPPATSTDRRPVVCLPGLTRNSRDFEPVAARLTRGDGGSPARRCVTFDFRGRGASQHDPRPERYTPLVELEDVRLGLARLGIEEITAFGTSRGGIVTMLAGLVAPGLVAAAVLNDIGVVVELTGLLRIKDHVGRALPSGMGWDELTQAMAHVNRRDFPRLDHDGFERFARRLFRDVEGRPALDYDPALSHTMKGLDPATPLPDLWPAFTSLTDAPVLLVRGALSDILSPETVTAMQAHHPRLDTYEAPDEGHAPLFEDAAALDALVAFLDRVGA